MKVKLFGAAKMVTGSCYGLITKEEKVLVDCGFFQGGKDMERLNYEDFGFNPSEYSALILTHAHLDHCGRIPKLLKYGFKGKIYATDATKDLAFIIMTDAAKIALQDTMNENERRAKEGLPPRKPIYNDIDVKNAMKLFVTVDYHEEFKVSKNIIAKFYDAGHILGAASVQVQVKDGREKKIIAFSGDLGQDQAVIVKNNEPILKADYVFIESTYGDRLHPPVEERRKEFLRIVKENYKRGGKLMIPSFAVERAQEILYYLGEFLEEGLIEKMPVYLDSPMAIKATAVFTKYTDYYNDTLKAAMKARENVFDFPGLVFTEKVDDSKKINDVTGPCIVIAGNGMCSAGRIKHHIRHSIENPSNAILFIGYQAFGTLGYWMKSGEKKVRLLGTQVSVNAKVESIEGFSAHADYKGLMKWLEHFAPKPKKVFICHGEETQIEAFSKRLEKDNFKTHAPKLYEEVEL